MKRSKLIIQYEEFLTLKNYRPSTKRSYKVYVEMFFDFCIKNRDKYETAQDYAKAFLLDRFSKGYAWASVNVYYSSLVILFKNVLSEPWDYDFVPRPRGFRKLATVLSGSQIQSMINNTANLKHKTMLVILYTAGVRISELINLNIEDVLIDRKQLKINMGKGGKDRVIQLPDFTIKLLLDYFLKYNPNHFLIEGNPKTQRYSQSSIRKILDRTAIKSGIPSHVTAHSFRYAYATHHIENGTDLVTLQLQLGHKNIHTTIKYLNLCQLQNRRMNHPIEQLNIK